MIGNLLGIGKNKKAVFHSWLGDRMILSSDGSSCTLENLPNFQNFEKVNIDNHMDCDNCINYDNNKLLTLEMMGRWKKPILPIF